MAGDGRACLNRAWGAHILDAILRGFIRQGSLVVRWPDGRRSRCQGATAGPSAGIALDTAAAVRGLLLNPGLRIGECYMDGTLRPLDCTIYDVLDVLMANIAAGGEHPLYHLRDRIGLLGRRLSQHNVARQARRNVAHHYDLNGRLYSLFLDRDRQYSCAYFPRGDETLEQAQLAKKRHIAAKLLLRPDMEVLDIGCGWGGLALHLAQAHGARVLGITLSLEQLTEARRRAAAAGLADRVRFELMGYRALRERFDRVVAVGMFEHVGLGYYGDYFDTIHRALKPDGVALVHAIGRSDGPSHTNAWVRKYIFPGGYSPALSEVLPAVERSGLVSTDIEILRLHYAQTLALWRWRFAANRDAIAALYDERFCRMFEFYLAGSELAFRRQGHMVWQLQLARSQEAVPLTRDYMRAEQAGADQMAGE